MKKKRKLAVQLFAATFVIIAVLIGALLAVQSVFFGNFYTAWKTDMLQRALDEYIRVVSQDDISYTQWLQLNNEFAARHNASVSVRNADGVLLGDMLRDSQKWYTIVFETSSGKRNKAVLTEYDILSYLNGETLSTGDFYGVLAVAVDEQYLLILGLMDDNAYGKIVDAALNSENTELESASLSMEPMRVLDVYETLPEEKQYYGGLNGGSMLTALDSTVARAALAGTLIRGELMSFSVSAGTMVMNNENLLTIEKTAQNSAGDPLNYQLTASLQPVDEASAAISSYYPWFFLTAALVALIVSWVYSRLVARPVTGISRAANRMAAGELDTVIEIENRNEIGVLGESLNSLSASLKRSLGELKEANSKLMKDIAQKEVQEQARRDFTANVSHDLKTPLGVMRCYVDLIRDSEDPQKREEYTDIITAEIDKMNKTVLKMLRLAKAEAGDVELHASTFSMEALVRQAAAVFAPQFEEKNIMLSIQGTFAKMKADLPQMEQAVVNLMENAARYALPSTTADVMGAVANGRCKFSITNRCRPITQAQADQLFKRFYTLDKSRNENGTGLGLSICAAVFKSHGMAYGAESHGDGITFWFEYDAVKEN